jgi:hypothetical protein
MSPNSPVISRDVAFVVTARITFFKLSFLTTTSASSSEKKKGETTFPRTEKTNRLILYTEFMFENRAIVPYTNVTTFDSDDNVFR